ncbi:MAG TPA: LamG domain-containing protein [Kofleriaceae bacterium]
MVLIRLALLALVSACGQSLFDNNPERDGGGSGSDGDVANACPETCIGDVAADFDGTAGGTGDRWRYFEDVRNRAWVPMTPTDGKQVGADVANAIASCAATPGAAACTALPGALLVSTSGATGSADPAFAWTSATPQVIQLSVRVHQPSGGAHVARVYRNSREDVLFTGMISPGTTFEQAITVDALPGDRFFLALAPTAMGTTDIGVHFYINATGAAFPAQCQLAVNFANAAGNNVDNLCGPDLTHHDYTTGEMPPVLAAGPFTEQGMAAELVENKYFESMNVIDRSGDTTTQLWIKNDMLVPLYSAWAFSDLDLNAAGGLGIVLFDQSGAIRLEVNTCTSGDPLEFAGEDAPYPSDGAWHFVRAVHTGGNVKICLDGVQVASFPVPAGNLGSTYHPYVGKNVVWTPAGAFWDGRIDDVRVLSTALPCN